MESKNIAYALAITVLGAIIEILGSIFTGSLALASDAGHMIVDVSALGMCLAVAWFVGKTENDNYQTKAESTSAIINALMLFAISFTIAFEAIDRIRQPAVINVRGMTIVAVFGLLVNIFVIIVLRHRHNHSSINSRGAFLHVLGDLLTSVGVIIGSGLIWLTGWIFIDPILSIIIAAVITWGAARLFRDAVKILFSG